MVKLSKIFQSSRIDTPRTHSCDLRSTILLEYMYTSVSFYSLLPQYLQTGNEIILAAAIWLRSNRYPRYENRMQELLLVSTGLHCMPARWCYGAKAHTASTDYSSSVQGTQLTTQAALHQRRIIHPSLIGDICTSRLFKKWRRLETPRQDAFMHWCRQWNIRSCICMQQVLVLYYIAHVLLIYYFKFLLLAIVPGWYLLI